MATTRLPRSTYDALVQAHRLKPGNHSHAARTARVGVRTARRAYLEGWERPAWARAIRDVLAQEGIGARARVAKESGRAELAARLRDEKERARIDAEVERGREAQGVRASLNTSLMLLGNIGIFSKASIEMCKQAAADLTVAVAKKKVTWQEALKILGQLALIAKRATEQLETAMGNLRKHLGEPERLLGIAIDTPPTYVDGQRAVDRLGEDNLRKAILDLASGEVDSPEAMALVEMQVEQATRATRMGGQAIN